MRELQREYVPVAASTKSVRTSFRAEAVPRMADPGVAPHGRTRRAARATSASHTRTVCWQHEPYHCALAARGSLVAASLGRSEITENLLEQFALEAAYGPRC